MSLFSSPHQRKHIQFRNFFPLKRTQPRLYGSIWQEIKWWRKFHHYCQCQLIIFYIHLFTIWFCSKIVIVSFILQPICCQNRILLVADGQKSTYGHANKRSVLASAVFNQHNNYRKRHWHLCTQFKYEGNSIWKSEVNENYLKCMYNMYVQTKLNSHRQIQPDLRALNFQKKKVNFKNYLVSS